MRIWGIAGAVVLVGAAYWGWPYAGAYGYEQALARSDLDTVVARTDFPAVRRSFAKQVIHAYLRRSGRANKLGSLGSGLAVAIGTSVADPYVSDLISPDNLATLLGEGQLRPLHVEGRMVEIGGRVPRLSDVLGQKLLSLVLSSYYDGPTSFVFNAEAQDRDDYGIHFHLSGTEWRFAGVDLPEPILDRIADDILAREKAGRQS